MPVTPGAPGSSYPNAQQIISYLMKAGYSLASAAGIYGNIFQESGGNPEATEIGGGGGEGLIQWTGTTPQPNTNIITGNESADLNSQLQDILNWAKNNGSTPSVMNAAVGNSPSNAAQYFEQNDERAGIPDMANRVSAAQGVYNLAKAGGLGALTQAVAAAPASSPGSDTQAADTSGLLSGVQAASALVHDAASVLNDGYQLVEPGQTWRLAFAGLGTVTAVQALRSYGTRFPLSMLLAGGSATCWYMALRAWPASSSGHPIRPAAYLASIAQGKPPAAGPAPANVTSDFEAGIMAVLGIWAAGKAAGAISSAGGLLSNLFGKGGSVEKDIEAGTEDAAGE